MGLIDFNNSINKQIEKQNQLIADLKKKSPSDRFHYPTKPGNADQLNHLLPFSWKGIQFPVTNVVIDGTRDLAQHKYPNRDGARVEDMGRNPLIIKATGIFVNTIEPAANEKWPAGGLYPQVYGQLLSLYLDPTEGPKTGTLVHPNIGNINCKLQSMVSSMDATFRGGELVNFVWVETINDDKIDQTLDSLKSQLANATATASQLDNSINGLTNPDPKTLFPFLTPQAPGLLDSMNQIKAIIDTSSLIAQSGLGTVNSIIYKCNQITNSIQRANDTALAVINGLTFQLRAQLIELRKSLLVQTERTVGIFAVRIPMTLNAFAQQSGSDINDLMKLNPGLLKSPTIPAGVVIRFYKK